MTAPDVLRHDYATLLVEVHGFEAPLERAFAETRTLRGWIDPRPRARAELIQADLAALGLGGAVTGSRVRTCDQVPFITAEEALGWMYVADRITLLHDPVRRCLAARLPVQHALSYLTASAETAGKRWEELGQVLDTCCRTSHAVAKVAVAARQAFRCQHAWYSTRASAQRRRLDPVTPELSRSA